MNNKEPDLTQYGYTYVSTIQVTLYANIYKYDTSNGPVIIKHVYKNDNNVSGITQLKREHDSLSSLDHPNIVKLLGVIDTETDFCIILEFCHKLDLYYLIDECDKLDERFGKGFMLQIALAIQYCHKKGIAHRDIKPENILITTDGVPKLADFGLSTRFTDKQKFTQKCGSIEYVAPEVIMGEPYSGDKADMWSFGTLLYVCFSGNMPFNRRKCERVFSDLIIRDIMPAHFSSELQDLVCGLMMNDPDTRLTSEDLMRHPWFSS